MSYLTREDGERFVIPSYRDVIAKRKATLKDELLELSAKYGEFITFQRRGLAKFEVAFSQDAGYLFGECVWSYFKKPLDLIYCEARPDTTEAYFVIVKDGNVYLDGTFSLENIVEELLVFTTQKNNFDIYVYGDVPLSEQPEEGKIAFDPATIKSFNRLSEPLFQNLPTVKVYQLQLIDQVLRQQGIGAFPTKQLVAILAILGLAWMGYTYMTLETQPAPTEEIVVNPFLDFNNILASVAPDIELAKVVLRMEELSALPGWVAMDVAYSGGNLTANVKSSGTNLDILNKWAEKHQADLQLTGTGFVLILPIDLPPKRALPKQIYPLNRVIMNLIDRITLILPGNVVKVAAPQQKGPYKQAEITIDIQNASPNLLLMLAAQLRDLPLVLSKLTFKQDPQATGTLTLQALGS